MTEIKKLITDNLDLWTNAIKPRASTGRGSSSKRLLIGINSLRELILDLAVKGKLVEQLDTEESALIAVKNAKKERTVLELDKKLKKNKPLPELCENDVSFDVPKGWCIAYIPEVLSFDKYALKRGPFGSALKKAYFVPSGFKVYEQQHAINDDFSLGEYYIDSDKFEELKAFEVKPLDLIISCSGTVGKVAEAPTGMEKGIINQALLKVSLNNSVLLNDYFKILFPSFYMKTETLSDLKGTAQKNMVSVDTLKTEPFPLPCISEQLRIVNKVKELMALCDQLEQQTEASIDAHQLLVEELLSTLFIEAEGSNSEKSQALTAKDGGNVGIAGANSFEQNWARIAEHFDLLFTTEHSIEQLKQTILQLAVMGKLVPQDPSDEPASKLLEQIAQEKEQLVKDKIIKKQKTLPAISEDDLPYTLPTGWKWSYLSDVASFENGDRSKRYPNASDLTASGIPFFGAPDIVDGKLSFTDELRFISEDKFAELSNGKLKDRDFIMLLRGTVGKTAQFIPNHTHDTGFINAQMLIIRFFNTDFDSYMANYFNSKVFTDFILNEKSGAVIQQIPASKIGELKVPVPPIIEQKRIAEKVGKLFTLCEKLILDISRANSIKVSLAESIVERALN